MMLGILLLLQVPVRVHQPQHQPAHLPQHRPVRVQQLAQQVQVRQHPARPVPVHLRVQQQHHKCKQ